MMKGFLATLSSMQSWRGDPNQADQLPPKAEGITRIVAVGDSITDGYLSSDRKTKSWPAQLMNMLYDTSKYEVINLGIGGRTMMKNGDYPYWNETQH